MKTIPAVKGVREGVDVRTGVCRDSDSVVRAADDARLVGMVIFGLGFSVFAGCLVEGPGLLKSCGSSLTPPKEDVDGFGSESESEDSILQMGR